MLKKKNKVILPILLFAFILSSLLLQSRPKIDKYSADNLLRKVEGVFDLQKNSVSNIQFYTTNYGIFGLDVKQNRGGGFWPRSSQNQYIFAGGIWFGAIKKRPKTNINKKYVTITYNPHDGGSWMTPGRMNPDNTANDVLEQDKKTKYRVYFSTDFGRGDGMSLVAKDGESWPIWDTMANDTLKNNRYFGYYVDETSDRTRSKYPKGPAFISGEDIFCTYKDTDLSRYGEGAGQRRNEGYPLRLQFEQMIYSWGFGDYRDFIFLKYDITNYSQDTLKYCWMAPVMDVDIALSQNSTHGARNDRCRFFNEDTTLNLAFQWTEGTQGEKGHGFGYLGFDFLESPAVFHVDPALTKVEEKKNGNVTTYSIKERMALITKDTVVMRLNKVGVLEPKDTVLVLKDTLVKSRTMVITDNGGKLDTVVTVHLDITNYLRKDKRFYSNREQIGLRTFRNWAINDDKTADDDRYNFISSGIRDGDDGAGDKRFLMATGPFHMVPGDTVRVVVAMMCAKPSVRQEADGSKEDLKALINLDKFAQKVYDDNFRAPMPPCPSKIYSWTPLNNAVQVKWDSTSETCLDDYEEGLDFLGYRLYRARRYDLDTFNIYNIGSTTRFTKGEGPFGWKQIAEWKLPTPFQKSVHKSNRLSSSKGAVPFIDSLRIVGPYYDKNGKIDLNSVTVMRVGQGVRLFKDSLVKDLLIKKLHLFDGKSFYKESILPVIAFIDTSLLSQPWGPFYEAMVNKKPFYMLWYNPYKPTSNTDEFLNNIAIGRVQLDPALVKFNPLLNKIETLIYDITDTALIPNIANDTVNHRDTIYFKNRMRDVYVNGVHKIAVNRVTPLPLTHCMIDSTHIKQALAQIYKFIKEGKAKTIFPNFVKQDPDAMKVITSYMAKVTNNRTFLDYGDDNRDGRVEPNANPAKTEKLLNGVDYYYRILAYDEGDYNQPTPEKLNSSSQGSPNQKKTHPIAAPAADYSKFEVTYVDSAKIGGLYNFDFFTVNPDRVNQLFAGHVLELEFSPAWTLSKVEMVKDRPFEFGMYYRDIRLRDTTTGKLLFAGRTVFEATPCSWSYRGGFTENAVSWYMADTVVIDTVTKKEDDFGTFYSQKIIERSGYFTTGDFTQFGYCYSFSFMPPAQNVFGFKFDYKIQQFGGHFRPDTAKKVASNAVTPVVALNNDPMNIFTTQAVGANVYARDVLYRSGGNPTIGISRGTNIYGSMNNGPGDFLLTFEPGGVEEMALKYNKGASQNTFKVPYLTMKIVNTMTYKRPDKTRDSVTVSYPTPLEPAVFEVDTLTKGVVNIPHSLGEKTDEFIGKYNLSSLAFVNGRYSKAFRFANRKAYPTSAPGNKTNNIWVAGHQNRYYLTAISVDGKDTVDFVNKLNIAGCEFVFDYINKGYFTNMNQWDKIQKGYVYGQDFKAGDKVKLPIRGGAFGLPAPGAKVRIKVTNGAPIDGKYTKKMLEQVKVVPNPYYISHQMQKSPYDAKLFFTKLPPVCTISIYTVAGDLIKEIHHDENTSTDPYQHAVDVWDLLSRNSQRVQSQTLVALITEPNGTESVVQFSIVVGGFRLIQEKNK